jgi:hypothetical protein
MQCLSPQILSLSVLHKSQSLHSKTPEQIGKARGSVRTIRLDK